MEQWGSMADLVVAALTCVTVLLALLAVGRELRAYRRRHADQFATWFALTQDRRTNSFSVTVYGYNAGAVPITHAAAHVPLSAEGETAVVLSTAPAPGATEARPLGGAIMPGEHREVTFTYAAEPLIKDFSVLFFDATGRPWKRNLATKRITHGRRLNRELSKSAATHREPADA